MRVHLVDGTYELFRHFFALPSHVTSAGEEVAAVRGVVGSLVGLLEDGATHVGVATDHVIESFRNDLYPGYKTGEGIDPTLRAQFPLLEDALRSAGFCVWPMVEFEADDALASAALRAAADQRVEQVMICTPDKDLAQCVTDDGRIVQYDRRKRLLIDRDAVVEKFGVPPESIPDYLALVGDSADGFPGLAGWGAKSTAAVLARYGHLEDIPAAPGKWDVPVRGVSKLAARLREELADAVLFRTLATLDADAPTIESVDEVEWRGPRPDFLEMAQRLEAPGLAERTAKLATARR
ncbi:MAG: flap endonuclease [Acidimicrobiales bacterium]|nr:flap endonuclease [Acidimicrobiales bacterium]